MNEGYMMVQLYCPINTSSLPALEGCRKRLLKSFGGYTVTHGRGVWRHPDTGEVMCEFVEIVSVAVPLTLIDTFKYLAEQYKIESGEHTVMYCIGSEVFFV